MTPKERKLKHCLHELCGHLTGVSGFLELQKLNQARLQLRKAITEARKMQSIMHEDDGDNGNS